MSHKDEAPKEAAVELVDLPWGQARVAEVVSVATSYHDVSIERLEFEDGRQALRFAAYDNGKPLNVPLVIQEEDIVHIARSAGYSPRIRELLRRLAAGIDAT